VEHGGEAASPEEGVARWTAMFDRAARTSAEGSVALYSLGDVELLRAATEEVVERLRSWGLLGKDRRVLDLGCGIGRLEERLAPEVASVVGLDISGEMLALARRRCAAWPNVHLVQGSGLDLQGLPDGIFDLVLAVDTFPYLVQAGLALVERHFSEARRVLRPGGSLVVLQLSYRGAERDRAEVRQLAETFGFVLLRPGTRELSGWDGLAFHLLWPGTPG
jgi:ubiquinone/menaquinone biosynthesis C-methylase UbiE